MPRELSPGLKILWVWTLGTAAVLVTSVVRTRMRDMENLTEQQQPQPQPQLQQHDTAADTETLMADTSTQSNELIREDKP
ncbi:uncharacterized protein LOC125472164 [Pyrus x bretschneideri]|uniref:uncharacterized protein LOC125472164 n=1 Tax=Pyrus x bretschneideri TaxID=225117 RepID=UPI002030EAED|nr:uncharacterized protein LOC125472164 [Pyrus x bretschneideri]